MQPHLEDNRSSIFLLVHRKDAMLITAFNPRLFLALKMLLLLRVSTGIGSNMKMHRIVGRILAMRRTPYTSGIFHFYQTLMRTPKPE